MGEVVPFPRRHLELVNKAPRQCGECGQFALSNNGVSYCLYWQEPVDFSGDCEEFEWAE